MSPSLGYITDTVYIMSFKITVETTTHQVQKPWVKKQKLTLQKQLQNKLKPEALKPPQQRKGETLICFTNGFIALAFLT